MGKNYPFFYFSGLRVSTIVYRQSFFAFWCARVVHLDMLVLAIILDFQIDFSISRYSSVSTVDCRYTSISRVWWWHNSIQGGQRCFYAIIYHLLGFCTIWLTLGGTCSSFFQLKLPFFPVLAIFWPAVSDVFPHLCPACIICPCIKLLDQYDLSAPLWKELDYSISLWSCTKCSWMDFWLCSCWLLCSTN